MPHEPPLLPWSSSEGVAIVAAHPDDEVIGAGGHFRVLRDAAFIHITDGAPRNGRDSSAGGFASPHDYARARAEELAAALAVAGIGSERCEAIGMVDQESSFHLCRLTLRLADLFRENRTRFVLTHPYEGGHPDHDSAAFAVRAACRLLQKDGGTPPEIVEFTSYHNRGGQLVAGEFLPNGGARETAIELSECMRELKQRMFDCFTSQRHVLSAFPIGSERFRPAPLYDFTRAPHEGQLHYERFDWGMTGEQWRRLAARAARELAI